MRMEKLGEMVNPERVLPTTIEFLDIAGLVKGASQGEGLGNKFLGHIRSVDAIVHVVRCFEDENIVHVSGSVNPVSDIEMIQTELALADLDSVEKKLVRVEKLAKSGDRKVRDEAEFYLRLKKAVEQGKRPEVASRVMMTSYGSMTSICLPTSRCFTLRT